MNFGYIHLVLCHVPVLFIPLSTVLIGVGLIKNNKTIRMLAYSILLMGVIASVPVYLSGESAEHLVEPMGVIEASIEAHEEAAEFTFISSLFLGALTVAGLLLSKFENLEKKLAFSIVVAGFACSCLLIYTANLGGKIRHTELSTSTNKSVVDED